MSSKFHDHKSKKDDISSVWHYFLISSNNEAAKCKKCGTELKTKGGSTKGLHVHLKLHNIKVSRQPTENNSDDILPDKIQKLTNFYKPIENDQFSMVLARLVALNGLSFSVIVNSAELRKSLEARKFKVPVSPNTIRNKVLECYDQVRQQVCREISALKKSNEKFTISFDEWTATNNKRFINIIIHGNQKMWNTGLVRIRNSLTAENCIDIIEKRLDELNLDLSKDVVAAVSDGESTMVKVGSLIRPMHQQCLAHGIQLAVIDVLYQNPKKKQKNVEENAYEDDNVLDDEEDNFNDFFDVSCEEEYAELTENFDIHTIIDKVRKIVRVFRKSPLKNEVLQNYIKMDFGKELNLILDCKTRWNSMVDMVERFVKLEVPIKKAAIDLNIQFLQDNHCLILKELLRALKPIELAVKALCKRETNLCTAEAAINFMLNEIKNIKSRLSNALYESLKKRIIERRTIYSTLLNFLYKGKIEPSILDPNIDLKSVKKELSQIISKFCFENSFQEETEEVRDIEFIDAEENLEKKLQNALEASTMKEKCSETQSVSKIILQEVTLFIGDGNLGKYLSLAKQYLNTIPPTSVECERCFSTSGLYCNNIRSRLADKTLDALNFLKFYLQNN